MFFKLTSITAIALLATNMATAQTPAPKAPEPSYAISYNLGVTSDYRYRGISQTTLRPALQGGLDYAHKNGVYLGAWVSTIKWIKDDGKIANVDTGSSPVELDLYGGYKFEAAKDLTLDFGALQYVYTGNKYSSIPGATNANTLEFYGAATYGIFTAKYSRSQSNLFGVGAASGATNSKGSGYLDLSATIDLGNGYSVVPHVGNQTVKNNGNFAYTDYSLTANKDIDGLVLSGAFVTANTKNVGSYAYATPDGKNRGKGAIVVSLKKNF
jgi:uncharacterized protein (TIGR02001 family)